MKQLDFDRAFAQTPECIHESILTAFEKGEKAMKFRYKLTSALTAAAALLIVCGVTALGLNGREQPIDNAVVPLNSALSAQPDNSSDVASTGGHELPANTEIFVDVDPDAFVPWFYSTDEVVFTKPDGAYLHMDFNCARMDEGSVLDMPLLGSINELGLQLCPDCFTLGGMPVHHDGETACLPYHNVSGQESTLAEAVSGGLELCRRCFLEVYTAPGDLYMHCDDACTTEQIKKFIHSASAAGLDACPVCMPPKVDPSTGIEAPVIYSIPMPTPVPEDFIAHNPDWPVQQVYPSPTPPPMSTPTPPPVNITEIMEIAHALASHEMADSTPAPVSVSVANGETGDIISYMTLPAGGRETSYEMAEATPAPSFVDVSETIENIYAMASPTPEAKHSDKYPPSILDATPAFYSADGDSKVHVSPNCGGENSVSLLESLREGKHICTECSGGVYVLTDTTYDGVPAGGSGYTTSPMTKEYFHARSECEIAEDGHLLRVPMPEALEKKYSPCPNCFMDVYIQDDTYHLHGDCNPGMKERSYFANAVWDHLACPLCVQPYSTAFLEAIETAVVQAIDGTAQPGAEVRETDLREIAAVLGSLADAGVTLYTDPEAADSIYHSRISCQYMQHASAISYSDMFQNAYSVCGWCLNLDNKFAREVEYAYLPEIPLALAGINTLNEAVSVIECE